MRRTITLATLISVGAFVGAPTCLSAQTAAPAEGIVAPVPGPYRAAPVPGANPYSNPANARALPYWMRTQAPQPGAGAYPGGTRTPPVFIPGWSWSRPAPGQRRFNAAPWGSGPWGPPGTAPGNRPYGPRGARPGYGAAQQPQQPQR